MFGIHNVGRIYETTFLTKNSGEGLSFITLPREHFPRLPERKDSWEERYNFLKNSFDIESRDIVKDSSINEYAIIKIMDTAEIYPLTKENEEFAAYVLNAAMIPIENSPLSTESISNLLNSSGVVALGTYVGTRMTENVQLWILTVPAGMIIFGAAAGIARALEEGLRDRLHYEMTKEMDKEKTT